MMSSRSFSVVVLLSDFSKLLTSMVEAPFLCLYTGLEIETKLFVLGDKGDSKGNLRVQWCLYADMASRRLDERGSKKSIKGI
jgi:hypothetical protein